MTRHSLLSDLTAALTREIDLDHWLDDAAKSLAEGLDAERATVWLVDGERPEGSEVTLVTRVAVLPEVTALRQPLGRGVAGWVAEHGEVLRIDDSAKDARFDPSADRLTGFITRSILAAPIRDTPSAPIRGVVQVLNKRSGAWNAEDEDYLSTLGRELGRALALTTLAPTGDQPGLVLRGPFNRIVGRSPAMEAVYERIGLAAGTDVTVLFRGQTGTGKTLLARAIHVNSARAESPFVTVDCTTLPAALIESELFGHERGAFTGAERRVKGRLELAQGGTLFLDEIGDLPVELQGKLLRFLQDRTFERVGGRETLHAELRVITATHVDLEAQVKKKLFREDLYYRLRVLEIEVPALAERGPDEVERLALHFLERFARRYDRPASRFLPEALRVLRAHRFPGNVRELEHWIESAVVLSPDGCITAERLPRPRIGGPSDSGEPSPLAGFLGRPVVALERGLTLDAASAAYVRATVEALGGNQSEAARQLGVSRNTVAKLLKTQ